MELCAKHYQFAGKKTANHHSLMVLLTVAPAAKAAIQQYFEAEQKELSADLNEVDTKWKTLRKADVGSPVDHEDLIRLSILLVQNARREGAKTIAKEWRLESLLKGAKVYEEPPPPRPEPVSWLRIRRKFHMSDKLTCADFRV